MSFYNTTHETKAQLEEYREVAVKQEDCIADVFRLQPGSSLSPSEVWVTLGRKHPLTSVRRAITDLTAEGVLVRTERKKTGIYGRPEYCWRLNPCIRTKEQLHNYELFQQEIDEWNHKVGGEQ